MKRFKIDKLFLVSKIFGQPVRKMVDVTPEQYFSTALSTHFYSMISILTNCLLIVGNISRKTASIFIIKACFILLLCVKEQCNPAPHISLVIWYCVFHAELGTRSFF